MERTETFQVADIAAFADILPRLCGHNPDYDLTKRELTEKNLVGQRIYENLYPCEEVTLVPGRYASAPKAPAGPEAAQAPEAASGTEASQTAEVPHGTNDSQTPEATSGPDEPQTSEAASGTEASQTSEATSGPENPQTPNAAAGTDNTQAPQATPGPDNSQTPNTAGGTEASSEESECLLVQVSGESVGYIRKANYPRMKDLLDKGEIVSMSLSLHGGPYRMLFEDGTLEDGSAGYFGLLTVSLREAEADKKSSSQETGTMHYISTSYDTLLLEEQGKRGNAAIVLALLLEGFYLGFSIPYWIMVKNGRMNALPVLGGDLPASLLNPHMGMVIGAAVLALLAFFMKNSILPMLAGLLFAASAWTLPGYALFTVPGALLCMIAALRKKSGALLTFIKVVALFAVLGVSGWLLKDTALHFWNSKTFMIRPTGNEEAADSSDMSGENDGGIDDIAFDDGFDDDGFTDDGFDDDGFADDEFADEDFDEGGFGDGLDIGNIG